MRKNNNLFNDLYDYAISYYRANYFNVSYECKNNFLWHLELFLDDLRQSFYNLDKSCFYCFDAVDTKILRLRYGAYEGKMYSISKISSYMNMTLGDTANKHDLAVIVLRMKTVDYILNKVENKPFRSLIAEMDYTLNQKRVLMNAGIYYIEDLIKYNSNDLSGFKGVGGKKQQEIILKTHELGYLFKDEQSEDLLEDSSLKKVLISTIKSKKRKVLMLDSQISDLVEQQKSLEFEIIELLQKIDEIDNKNVK